MTLTLLNKTATEVTSCIFDGEKPTLTVTLDAPISGKSYHKLLEYVDNLRDILKINVKLKGFQVVDKLV